MNLKKPDFWNKKNLLAYIFLPLTLITHTINFFKKFSNKKQFVIKTICVGNIYIGGTGKTSLSILINEILKKKYKTVFIKKNYISQKDEINLLKKNGIVISKNNRINALMHAEKKEYDFAILDDGLQQKNIAYDLKIACFNSSEFIGNGFVLPAGPLRESIKEIKNYDMIFLNGSSKSTRKIFQKIKNFNKNIEVLEGEYVPQNIHSLDKKKNYLMFCGIGNPKEFESTLLKHKFKLQKKFIYADHHNFSDEDINFIKKIAKKNKFEIITTEKDYLRLNLKQKKDIKFLKINLKVNKINKLEKKLLNIK
ncbi:tetraacyldisaccharide 4'-kinase [Candidatus Pelagibacter sp. HIMB1587]|uniref:tetraacyldisaccharide 4'-kinase n=1 Tax=Candidatus Pelagibacter sp. HIMB1587 TaxID=3413354 RepID=UPI003F85FD48